MVVFVGYQERSVYFGAVCGRVAGRIKKGRFLLDGKEHALPQNSESHFLHGGKVGFDKVGK